MKGDAKPDQPKVVGTGPSTFGGFFINRQTGNGVTCEHCAGRPESTRNTRTVARYEHIYNDTKSMITALSGLTTGGLADAAIELQVDYEVFCADYRGPYLVDAYIGFAEMLRQWPMPWPPMEGSALNGLTAAQFFFAWAWEQNTAAGYCLGGKAVASGWAPDDAVECGIVAAVSAAKCLFHAKSLLDSGGNNMGQEPS